MPYLMGAPFPGYGSNPFLFDFDFRTLSPGKMTAADLLSRSETYGANRRGLTFTRVTNSTVQTSDSTLISNVGANEACIGNRTSDPTKTGIVLEGRLQNTIPGGGQNFVGNGWSYNQNSFFGGPSVPTGSPGQTSVDGNPTATQFSCAIWGFVNNAVGQTGKRTFTSWQTGHSQMLMENASGSGGNQPGTVCAFRDAASWARLTVVEGSTHTIQFSIADSREEAASGGEAVQARVLTADFAQLQYGTFATEAIVSGTASAAGIARDDDRLDYGVGSELISRDNQIRCRITFSPKFSTTDQLHYAIANTSSATFTAYWYLFSWGALDTNYARIRDSDHRLAVKLAGGSEYVTTNALSWSKFDVVVIELEIGAGVPSVARYSVNGGAWVDLVLATIPDVPAPGANPVGILRNVAYASHTGGRSVDDRGQPPCWLHRITFYNKTPVPSEQLLAEDGDNLVTEAGELLFTESS